jgi:NAD(P)-dependent dehydrogenase (short-subunit alcohol dehydrogenase family)
MPKRKADEDDAGVGAHSEVKGSDSFLSTCHKEDGGVAIVTGAAGAIGFAVCNRLLNRCGFSSVIACDARLEGKDVFADNSAVISVHGVGCNFEEADLRTYLQPVLDGLTQPLRAVICISGGNAPGIENTNAPEPGATPLDLFHAQYKFNFLSTVNVVNICMPLVKEAGGNIVLASSVNAITGIGEVAYSTCKAALHPYATNLACYYGKFGVTANAVALGTIHSPNIWNAALATDGDILKKIGNRNPRGRVGTPEDAAGTLCFLASPESKLINGQVIVADGGWTKAAGTVDTAREEGKNWFD